MDMKMQVWIGSERVYFAVPYISPLASFVARHGLVSLVSAYRNIIPQHYLVV